MLWLARALVWLCVSAGLLLAGFAVFAAAALTPSVIARGELPAKFQREALGSIYSALVTQALLPELAITFVVWLALARAFPRLDRSLRAQWLGLTAIAALAFPVVGKYLFTMWTPTGPRDYALTLILIAIGVSLALLVPRALSHSLPPGCFTIGPRRGMVDES